MTGHSKAPSAAKTRPGSGPSLALVLGGGAARGLAHVGVLEVLEREGIRASCLAGSSMGGLIGALSASGLSAAEVADVARRFHFPRWFLPGGILRWDLLFGSAIPFLPDSFEQLALPLLVTAVDLEAGDQVVLHSGPLLPAVEATCAVPGVLPAVKLGGRWLVDGGVLNVLPVDVAWLAEPDVVVAVKVGAMRSRPIPQLEWRVTGLLSRLGGMLPNPATAKVSLEVLVRTVEIILDRQMGLAAAMTGADVLIEPDLGDVSLRDFDRVDVAIDAGRRAAEAALPELVRALESPPPVARTPDRLVQLRFDPVCAMAISPSRARAAADFEGTTYYFCSPNCRDCFERDPQRYLTSPGIVFGTSASDVRRGNPAGEPR